MSHRLTIADLQTAASPGTVARNSALFGLNPRGSGTRQALARVETQKPCVDPSDQKHPCKCHCRPDLGRCQHTGRAYRSRTEARWAGEHPAHMYEPFAVYTPCGMYWPDFVYCGMPPSAPNGEAYSCSVAWHAIEVKGGWIRDRAMHKVKAAIRPARALGFAGIWLAQWKGGRWTVSEVQEG